MSRLGRGEFGVKLDLPRQDELGELGGFFNAVSAQLSADRTRLAGEKSTLESVVDRLEDAIAFFTPAGELLFANPAMLRELPERQAGGCWPGCGRPITPTARLSNRRARTASPAGRSRWNTWARCPRRSRARTRTSAAAGS